MTIEVTDANESPDIDNQTFYLEENSPNGYEVGLVMATDPDYGQTLTYSIVSGNIDEAFTIDANTGYLIVNDSSALNFEVTPIFWLIVKVQDNGVGNLYSQAIIMVSLMDINVSTNEISSDNQILFNLYPNPANSNINVEVEHVEDGLTIISIMDMSGSLIIKKEYEVLGGGLSKQIDIDGLNKGLYIVNIKNGESMIFEKFIKL